MKFYFPKVKLGSMQVKRPARSINPFTTKQVTLRVPVVKMPKIGIKLRNPFTKA